MTKITKNENTQSIETKSEIKKAPRKVLRRADFESQGRLYVDPKHKEPGYVYRIVNDTPGRINLLEQLGYDIVRDETQVGSDSSNIGHKLGSAVTVETSISGPSRKGILMRCPTEIYEERLAEKSKDNLAAFDQTVTDGQYKGQKFD